MTYDEQISFIEYLAVKLGTRKWVVASRLTKRMLRRGYKLAVSQDKFRSLRTEWEAGK